MALTDPNLVIDAMEKVRLIRERFKMAQSHQKSYSDVRKRDLEFDVDDWVYLKDLSMKGVMCFGKNGKLNPRYVGIHKILTYIDKVAYELDLPFELAIVHLVFYVLLLRKFMGDPNSIVPLKDMSIAENLSYEEVPVKILDRKVKRLINKEVVSVKVLWRNRQVESAT
ncbi:uncharacterized protein LOC129903625 [Solanum dulcamara]|uniref:uncharacterized protein LOC129903625 n=1 Tax=Solanum dulcamara TaxID=45834 RepID=UPI002486A8B1|nr:uncharacterized protein LOC129903625 [Solanum dulcamara]